MTGFSVFQHRLGHPRWHTKTIWAVKPEKPKGKEKRHTHTNRERGFGEGHQGFRFKLKRTGGWYFIQGPHSYSLTASTDDFAFRGRRDRVDRRRWSETKSDLHNTPTTQYSRIWGLLIFWFKMQSQHLTTCPRLEDFTRSWASHTILFLNVLLDLETSSEAAILF